MPSAESLAGAIVVITGAGSGIGRGTALVLAACGAHVIAVDRGNAGAAVAAEITQAGHQATGYAVDVSDRQAIETFFADVDSKFGRIDGIVTSAGIFLDGPAVDIKEADLDRLFAVNLKGTLWCAQAAAAIMVRQGSGSIVTLSSAVADKPAMGTAVYAMSKAAVVQLTRVMALELGGAGVRVNAISPGVIISAITERHYTRADGSVDEEKRETVLARLASVSPLNRVGDPEDIAQAALYLISDASKFMTGQVLRPNGGAAMP